MKELLKNLLTRFYRVSGQVIYGLQNGRKIGFPTANIDYGHYVVLKKGVYGVYITIKGKQYKGMANIGYNPTVGLIDNLSLEVNIFDFDQDIYERQVRFFFLKKTRNEIRFDGFEALKKQLQSDIVTCKNVILYEKQYVAKTASLWDAKVFEFK